MAEGRCSVQIEERINEWSLVVQPIFAAILCGSLQYLLLDALGALDDSADAAFLLQLLTQLECIS